VILRRRRPAEPAESPAPGATAAAAEPAREHGPWDETEVGGDDDRLDLGSLRVRVSPSIEVRLQVDEQTQTGVAALLVHADAAVELRAFAAPRNSGLWDEVRRDLAAEATRRGGTASEASGVDGPELKLSVPVRTPDGRAATQLSRVVGVDGPRWLLRATFLGDAAAAPVADELVAAFRDVVVVRGREAMAPGDPLLLRLPADIAPPAPPDQ
jgi:hypothetical protein